MVKKKHTVDLSPDERAHLEDFVTTGEHPAQAITRARILLKSDEGETDQAIAEALGCHDTTPYQVRKRYAERGLDAVHRKSPDRHYERKIDGDAEARLIALASSDPPEGRSRWTLRLLRAEFVALDEVDTDSITHETVRRRSENELQPHRQREWVIPPE